ncbi:Thsd4 [Phodopus roborovskii]|uniref:Thrombospondin type-1 domain-containing protein 4 n=1 Tax=Phodopus roborovskii TaxID=109678 RepID=A0AAU9ZVT5_PHORO|nr:Thsd4 [Phodopus roborovskii]
MKSQGLPFLYFPPLLFCLASFLTSYNLSLSHWTWHSPGQLDCPTSSRNSLVNTVVMRSYVKQSGRWGPPCSLTYTSTPWHTQAPECTHALTLHTYTFFSFPFGFSTQVDRTLQLLMAYLNLILCESPVCYCYSFPPPSTFFFSFPLQYSLCIVTQEQAYRHGSSSDIHLNFFQWTFISRVFDLCTMHKTGTCQRGQREHRIHWEHHPSGPKFIAEWGVSLRSRSGRSIINGNWAIDRPGKYEGGGTMFTYKRPNEISSTAGESFLAEGPTNEILDVYMIHQQPNPGVHYEYVIMGNNVISPQVPPHRRPGEPFNGQLETEDRGLEDRDERGKNQEKEDSPGEAPEVLTSESTHTQTFPIRHPDRFPAHRPDNLVPPAPQPPRRSRDHNWKQLGTTECSTTCGKGSQYPIFRCVNRNTHEEVPESYCDSSMKPTPEEEPCNLFPCPAFWDIGEWSECSKTCGLGMQHRQVLCRQVYANRSLTVQPYRCQHLEKPETTSTCQLKICSEWQIRTDWTSCSVPCGVGQRTRDVKCVSNIGDVVDDEECNMKLRPSDIENCDMGPCAKSWFLTEWSERCSAECGAGVRTRSVVCMTNHVSSLPLEGCGNNRPAETTPCDNGPCTGKVEWFAGSWSQCSVECGSGTQQREVICVRKDADTFEVLDPYECSFLERPPSQQACHLKPCGAKWFSTEWSMCSKSCQGGFRVREVRCLSDDMTPGSLCDPQLKPEERESCNPQDCVPEVDENCKDKYYNCNVVVQARLCVYNYYKTACCASCTRVANRHTGFLGSR